MKYRNLEIFEKLIASLPEGLVVGVNIGLFWTAVMVECQGERHCGLAATLSNHEFEHARLPAVEEAGRLEQRPARKLASLVFSKSYNEVAIGLATINALVPAIENPVNLAAEDYIARHGANSQVALIGHFPFVSRLKDQVKKLWVLELNPKDGDLPASAAPEIIPHADILAITATALINHTFDGLFHLRKPDAKVLLLGPSTPLSPVMFQYGIHVLSGSIVEDADTVFTLVRQGATFHQIRDHGVRLVTLEATN